jgi:hypothetical protein
MSDKSLIKLKRSSVPGKAPTIENLNLGELAVNTNDGNIFLKREYFSETANTNIEEVVKFAASIPVENTIFIQKNGNDENDGKTWDGAVATFEKALEIAEARNTLTLIDVGPGVYETEGHLDMPDNTMIRAPHRAVVIRPKPGFEERNVFRMGSGCFLEGPIFEDFRVDDLENPTEGFAVSFRPGAVIRRVPYAHKIAVRTTPFWTLVPPPLDRVNGNPLVGRGGGVVLADGLVCSQYSVFPNIMTWGATPVSHNGIGYVAKNGGLINAVNAVSLWAHKHFVALAGGQIVLSSCSTQFGDFTLVADGKRDIVRPYRTAETLIISTTDAATIQDNTDQIIDDMWDSLVANNYTTGWDESDEIFTRNDAGLLLLALYWVILSGDQTPMINFARGLFDNQGNPVFSEDKEEAFIYSFEYIRDEIISLGVTQATEDIITDLIEKLILTITDPIKVIEPSTITAIGHTWTGIMAGVALTQIPPARNATTIQESIIEQNQGVVIASGQDDQGSALFIGGLEINADTGELSGPPFDTAVNRIATRASISRSF